MTRAFLLLLLITACSAANAVVIRHDVDDADYQVPASEFPPLVDLPGEGHGVLIAPQWFITAAHTLPQHLALSQVVINGIPRAVERAFIHPGYTTPPKDLIEQAMASGEAMMIVVALAASDDIALVRLTQPVTDVAPARLYRDGDEYGKTARIIGKGATGTGDIGHAPQGPNRTELRRAFNTITSAHGRWFCHVFDEPATALPLEGVAGNGDSGGAVLIQQQDQWRLAGLTSWKVVQGHVMTSRPGRYGQISCNVRLSHYAEWMERILSQPSPPTAEH